MDDRCSKLRRVINACLLHNLHSGATFFADKLIAFSGSCFDDKLLLARVWLLVVTVFFLLPVVTMISAYLITQCFYANKEYRRALSVLQEVRDQFDSPVQFKCLIAQCFAACGDWEECLAVTADEENGLLDNYGVLTTRTKVMIKFFLGVHIELLHDLCLFPVLCC
jgi:phage shock protein PspC (stress-responsive transcriptional regulator)